MTEDTPPCDRVSLDDSEGFWVELTFCADLPWNEHHPHWPSKGWAAYLAKRNGTNE